jgi:eukaryotic-like serine/threonine-protein kinase
MNRWDQRLSSPALPPRDQAGERPRAFPDDRPHRRDLERRIVGRYAVFDAIATGGMATVHFGRLIGPAGFSRTVVIKRLHAQYAGDAEFATMFLDEARVAARIHHPNVVTVIDVVAEGREILLVMEYVHGESLAFLSRAEGRGEPRRLRILGNVISGALQGLHAAHEATGENGRPLGVVHRDVSPQNILVGADGNARMLDFGIAKAAGQVHCTGAGQVKGKIRYLSPEQVMCGDVDRRADLWAAAVVLWEALTGKKLFSGDCDGAVLSQVLNRPIPSPRELEPEVPEDVARVVMRGLERDRTRRFATAQEMATALEEAVGLLPPREVGAWVERLAHARLGARQQMLDDIEAETVTAPISAPPTRPTPRPAAAQAFAVTTDAAMVRESTPAERAPRARARAPMIAWGSSAAVVLAIAAGVGARSLVRAHAPTASASPALPPVAVAETTAILASDTEAAPPTVPLTTPPTVADAAPTASARAHPAGRPAPRGRTPVGLQSR